MLIFSTGRTWCHFLNLATLWSRHLTKAVPCKDQAPPLPNQLAGAGLQGDGCVYGSISEVRTMHILLMIVQHLREIIDKPWQPMTSRWCLTYIEDGHRVSWPTMCLRLATGVPSPWGVVWATDQWLAGLPRDLISNCRILVLGSTCGIIIRIYM